MTLYARTPDGVVMEIIDVGVSDINTMFHADIVAQCVECDSTVKQGYLWNGNVFSAPPPPPPITAYSVTYEAFQDRFTQAEMDGMTDYIYETDVTTGMPKRQAIIQAYQRDVAANSVDLLAAKTDTFLTALVAAGVVTEARKTAILDPLA